LIGASLFGPTGSPGATGLVAGASQSIAPASVAMPSVTQGSATATPSVPPTPSQQASASPIPTQDSAWTRTCAELFVEVLGITGPVDDLCLADGQAAVEDPIGDRFAQDGLPPPTLDERGDMGFAGAIQRYVDSYDFFGEVQRCAVDPTVIEDFFKVLCNDDQVPPAEAIPIVTYVHLARPLDPSQQYTFGLYVRYDETTPGREAPDGFPLSIGNGAHVLYAAQLNVKGGYDPPTVSDFRSNTGAYSNHIQLLGPDWFAFITFDDAPYVRPFVCQIVGDRSACDVPYSPQTAEEMQDIDLYLNWQASQ
jgi:hypothetical protein